MSKPQPTVFSVCPASSRSARRCHRRLARRPAASGWFSLLFAAALATGCSTADTPTEKAREFLVHGDVWQAYVEIQQASEANPEDVALRERLQQLRAAYHLGLGQEKVFADDDWGGVEEFERVLLIDPENKAAKEWKGKALAKLAERATRDGDAERARGRLDDALRHYQKALSYVPEFPGAVYGSKVVGDVVSSRRTKSQENYLKGVRAQATGEFEQTRYHMQIAIDNDPSLAAARERSDVARQQLAEARLRRAREAEQHGWFETSLREYKAVFAEFPTLAPDLATRVAANEREVDAAKLLRDASLLVQRGEFAKARKQLEQAYERSVAQRAAISAQLIALRETDLDRRYNAALDLELDYRYADALAAYRDLDKEWPGQLDVRTRISNLESSVSLAKEACARGEAAEQAGDVANAIAAYREALTYAPKFGDLEARVKALRAKLEPKPEKSESAPAKQPSQ